MENFFPLGDVPLCYHFEAIVVLFVVDDARAFVGLIPPQRRTSLLGIVVEQIDDGQ